MAADERYFVEWKEEYVSKERGHRVVHYFLKDNLGESVLAVVGTERSVRHMFYVVAEEILSVLGAENSVNAGFRWRSRREVVNWLTSMLSKQHCLGDYAISPKDDPTSVANAQKAQMASHKSRLSKNLKGHHLDISWSGVPSACGKQLKHYPSFCRNGISIAVHSFVFVMAEKENRYLAYLEDMYEDKKCQKKVKVRWFHHNREVKGVASLRDLHPKEVFITPYVQVISAECVDGPAIVLTREHYEKCLAVFPHDLIDRVHFCFRQFKSNRVKPFKLSKLRGYFDQPIFSCFSPDFFEEGEFSSEDDVKVGTKRNKSCQENQKLTYDLSYHKLKFGLPSKKPGFMKHVESFLRRSPTFTPNEKVEILCHDSGLRGCWFRCTVLEVSRRHIKVLYDDVNDEDSCTNLEEWIPAYREAKADKLGMRHPGRPTIRPAYPSNDKSFAIEVGHPADAWWSDGWWEGVITCDYKNGSYQFYVPGENLYMNVELKNLRISRDWVGDRWVDVEPKPNILCIISAASVDTKLSTTSVFSRETKADNSPNSCHGVVTSSKLDTVEEDINDLGNMTLINVPLKDDQTSNEQQPILEAEEKEYNIEGNNEEGEENNMDYDVVSVNIVNDTTLLNDNGDDEKKNNIDNGSRENIVVEHETVELECEAEKMELMTEC